MYSGVNEAVKEDVAHRPGLSRLAEHPLWVYAVLALLTLILYYPVLNNQFLSDDFLSLYRINIEKRILYREFLRPLMDVSFYLNYLVSGMNPWSYYLLNLVIHVLNACFLYRFALRMDLFRGQQAFVFAFLSAVLFLIYPFHNEGVVWLTGRLSSMAALAALCILNIWTGSLNFKTKFFLCVLVYLVGLLAYESILFVPFIVAAWQLRGRLFSKRSLRILLLAALVVTTAVVIRFVISGAVYGNYGERMLLSDWNVYLQRLLKVAGRIVLPPSENGKLLQVLFVVAIALTVAAHLFTVKKLRGQSERLAGYYKLAAAFIIAMVLPVLFGVSTRTSEGDRLFYFPSLFLCMLLAFWGLALVNSIRLRALYFGCLGVYFISFLLLNNRNWEKASAAAADISGAVLQHGSKQVYVVNLPDEYEGAYIFRNGFSEFLVLNNIDTAKVVAVNHLTRLAYLEFPGKIPQVANTNVINLPPQVQVQEHASTLTIQNISMPQTYRVQKRDASVYYWDNQKLIRVF